MSVARKRTFITVATADRAWIVSGVRIATSFRDRRRGVTEETDQILLHTGRVHGWGLSRPLLLVGIDGCGQVLELCRLEPRRAVRLRRAEWTLELPIADVAPAVGSRLEIYARVCDGKTLSLCDADRQPRRRFCPAGPGARRR